ncbi:type I secretion protein TolC [Massilia sp. Root418]|jgi:protease secretion system outer membrane protein|uniref:TolC family outer membrane protein n=1 Tax=Massilia sp. Root418 TaxID=1736532 RepID=UPI0006F83F30|nr:TolC family outer membrane protein [Massilia sp. Root418]KQW96549.1 type I secretion protein TolC [Massilia sp. Root418]
MSGLNKRLAVALKVAFSGVLLYAGSASAMTLVQAYEAALVNDPTYQQAVQDAEAGKEYRILGRAALLPTVQANYSASKVNAEQVIHTSREDVPSSPKYISRSASVSFRQTLFNLDALARYKQGNAQAAYALENFAGRTQEMVVRVLSAYMDALFANEQVRIATAQRDTYLEQKAVNDLLFKKGEGTKTDMLETQARLEVAEAQLLEAKDSQQAQMATLAGIVGQEVTSLDELRPDFRAQTVVEGDFEYWRKKALEQNPDLQAQVYAIEAARQEVNRNRAGHAPRLDFIASYSKADAETLNTYNQDTTNRSVGIQLTVPIYAGGAVSASTRQASAGLERAKAELQLRTDKVMVDLRKQYASVLSSTAKIQALDKAVSSGELLITATEQSIKGGVRINLDLLNARQQLYTTQRDLAQARYTYLLSVLRLRAAAGELGPDDVRHVAAYFR